MQHLGEPRARRRDYGATEEEVNMTQPVAGWYPDPHHGAQLRYFDGSIWTDHTSPAAPPAAHQAPVQQSVVTNVVVASAGPPKSVGLAFLLTFLFGPFGLLYVSVAGGIAMIVLNVVGGILTFGILNVILWPVEMVWAVVAAQNANKAVALMPNYGHQMPSHTAPPVSNQTPPAPAAPSAPIVSPPPFTAPPQPAPTAPLSIPPPPELPVRTGGDDPFAATPISDDATAPRHSLFEERPRD